MLYDEKNKSIDANKLLKILLIIFISVHTLLSIIVSNDLFELGVLLVITALAIVTTLILQLIFKFKKDILSISFLTLIKKSFLFTLIAGLTFLLSITIGISLLTAAPYLIALVGYNVIIGLKIFKMLDDHQSYLKQELEKNQTQDTDL